MRDLETLNVRDFLEDAAAAVPNAPFLITDQEEISFREFNRRVDLAACAWHRLGVRKAQRVAFMLENRAEFLQAWLGLAKIGGILVALNTRWQETEIRHFLELCQPRLALVSEQYEGTFRSALSSDMGLERVLSLDELSTLSRQAEPMAPPVELSSGDVISFISTSGTTGRPKAVMQTHGNYVLTGEGYASWVELRAGERIYLCLPLFHINSQAYSVMGAIAARATIVLVERFSASHFWEDMVRFRVEVFNYIGLMIAILMKAEPTAEERRHSVRLTYGGPAFPGPVREQIEERFGLTLLSGIGMSENTFGLIESLHGERRSGSLGKPRQHPDPRIVNEARVVDDEGSDVSRGEVGELIYRNPVLMKGYYRDPEQTAETIRDGWLYTGDLVRQDEDGFFYFVDRKKEIIRVRGENVAPAEVERVMDEHPAVQEVAVVGVPSELAEEDVAAFVVSSGPATLDAQELIEWCRPRLASFKIPRYVWPIQALPKTETLRVEKHRLRERAQELLAAMPATAESERSRHG